MKRTGQQTKFLLLVGLLFLSCATIPPPQPTISRVVWKSVPRDKVFESCLKALHLQGYTMQATDSTLGVVDKSLGIIGTDWIRFREGAVSARYRFNFLVSETTPGTVSVSVSPKAQWAADSGYSADEESSNAYISNRIGKALENLFAEIEKLIGSPPTATESATYDWK